MRLFNNRMEAAHDLARHLTFLRDEKPIVLGLANGGVPIAEVIAQALDAPLDVLLIERLAAPRVPNQFIGAVDEHGRISMIKATARWHHITNQELIEPARELFRELQRKRGRIRALLPELDVRDRTVIICCQGVATGAKMLGAVASVRDRGARKIIVAAPAGGGKAAWQLHDSADLVVIPHRPTTFRGVEQLYKEYFPVTDAMVETLIERWVRARPTQPAGVKTIVMKVPNEKGDLLCCELDLPAGATRGSGPYPAVLFAHRFESEGRSPRTVPISRRLAKREIVGVRMDFTGHGRSAGELNDATETRMYDDLKRVLEAVRNLNEIDSTRLGIVGSGNAALLALNLAAEWSRFSTIVVRGPMCGQELAAARMMSTPTLLIYADGDVVYQNEQKRHTEPLPPIHELLEVPDAPRLFNDEISRELVVSATVDWLSDHLRIPAEIAREVSESDEESDDANGATGARPRPSHDIHKPATASASMPTGSSEASGSSAEE